MAIARRIFDFNDDYGKGRVSYTPTLQAPSADAPAYVRAVRMSPESPVGIQSVAFDIEFSRAMDTATSPSIASEKTSGLTWATRAPMPTARDQLAAAAANNRIYAIGGYPGPKATVEEYDTATDAWRTRSPMPTARNQLAAVALDGRIYAIGGDMGWSAAEEYDPTTDTWRSRAPMPTERWGLGAAVASGRIYAIGGHIWLHPVSTVEEYDPATDTWRTRSPMPTARTCLGAAAAGGRIYAIGGNTFETFATVEEYDPATDTWRARSPMPTARTCLGVVAANGRIYAIGGYGLSAVEEYDPATDTWRALGSMSTARSGLGVAAASDYIYAIGGEGGSTMVEEARLTTRFDDFASGQWLATTQYRTTYDLTTLVPRGAYSLTVSSAVGADGIEIAPYSGVTFTVDYGGYVADTTPPAKPTVIASIGRITSTVSARWSTADPESGISLYGYAIGTRPGGTDVMNWTNLGVTQTVRSGLNLIVGQTYYVSVKARNEGGLWSEPGVSTALVVPRYAVFLPVVTKAYAGW